jgi:hypothetical protein
MAVIGIVALALVSGIVALSLTRQAWASWLIGISMALAVVLGAVHPSRQGLPEHVGQEADENMGQQPFCSLRFSSPR